MNTQQTSFVPAGSTNCQPIEQASTVALPAIDGSTELVVSVTGPGGAVYLSFGTIPALGFGGAGVIVVGQGAPIMLTTNPTILAACAQNAMVLGGQNAINATTLTTVTALTTARGATITFTRGTANSRLVF